MRHKFLVGIMAVTMVGASLSGCAGSSETQSNEEKTVYGQVSKVDDEITIKLGTLNEEIANNNGSLKSEPPQKPKDNEDSNQAQDNSYQNNNDLEKSGTNGVSEEKAPDNKFKPVGVEKYSKFN